MFVCLCVEASSQAPPWIHAPADALKTGALQAGEWQSDVAPSLPCGSQRWSCQDSGGGARHSQHGSLEACVTWASLGARLGLARGSPGAFQLRPAPGAPEGLAGGTPGPPQLWPAPGTPKTLGAAQNAPEPRPPLSGASGPDFVYLSATFVGLHECC